LRLEEVSDLIGLLSGLRSRLRAHERALGWPDVGIVAQILLFVLRARERAPGLKLKRLAFQGRAGADEAVACCRAWPGNVATIVQMSAASSAAPSTARNLTTSTGRGSSPETSNCAVIAAAPMHTPRLLAVRRATRRR
jgi:hypothetical protein